MNKNLMFQFLLTLFHIQWYLIKIFILGCWFSKESIFYLLYYGYLFCLFLVPFKFVFSTEFQSIGRSNLLILNIQISKNHKNKNHNRIKKQNDINWVNSLLITSKIFAKESFLSRFFCCRNVSSIFTLY